MLVTHMREHHGVSIRQGCTAVDLPRSSYSYEARPRADEAIVDALNLEKHPLISFWQAYHRLRLAGHAWNQAGLPDLPAIGSQYPAAGQETPPGARQTATIPAGRPNEVWSLDFMHDSLWDGRTFRLLNINDDYNREVLFIETDTSLPATRVIRVLEQLQATRGLPNMIRVDNGPEFVSHKLNAWCKDHKIALAYIQPGKPTQNAYIERLNGSLRRELLNAYVFRTLDEVRQKADEWQYDYNHNRPHKALGYRPRPMYHHPKLSTFEWTKFPGSLQNSITS